jgi:glycosyltransferase involved in cell wall biosynthesis
MKIVSRKIMLVDLGVDYGGSMVYMESLQRLLGDKVTFMGICVNQQAVKSLRAIGITTYSIAFIRKFGKPVQILTSMVIVSYLKLLYRFDTVWVQGITDIMLLPLARLLGCKAVITRHLTSDIRNRKRLNTVKRHLAEFAFRHLVFAAQQVFCVSQTVANDLVKNIPLRKIVTIPNWVPSLPTAVKHVSVGTYTLRLLFVGRLKKHKGASLIINALRKFKGNAVSLTIVGDGECRQDLESQAKGLNVKFIGFQKNPSSFYQNADVFIQPTLGPEGLPLVSLEAMSYGLPCIFSDLPVHKEITDNGRCAVLFHCGNSDDLCAKIKLFLVSPELLNRYGKAGREMIANKYSAASARTAYLKALEISL